MPARAQAGIAAKLEGMEFIGIEMSEEYCELARARIEAARRDELGE